MSKPRRIATDATELGSITLPQQTETYTVVSHSFIISETLEQLKLNGFEVESTEYCRNISGEVALGVYHLTHGNDPDLGLMFTWANSYDKSMRFRCAIGGFVHVSGSRMIAGDMSNYGRIHTGDAKEQVQEHIKAQMSSAGSYFNALCDDKDKMKDVILTDDQVAELMGVLYFKENVFKSSQLNEIKAEYKKPTFNYTTNADSLWTIYNHCILALKKAHPKTWMEQQKDLHKIIKAKFLNAGVIAPLLTPATDLSNLEVVDPAQISLLDQIEEMESENVIEVIVEESTSFNLDHIPSSEPDQEPEVEEVTGSDFDVDELNSSEAIVHDPNALTFEAYDAGVIPEPEEVEAPEGVAELMSEIEEDVQAIIDEPVLDEEDPDIAAEMELMTESYKDDVENGEYPEVTETELSEQLHGVNNDEEAITAEFPTAPEGTPEISDPGHMTEIDWGTDAETMKAAEESLAKEEAEETTPLEEQVAGEYVEPVTEAEEEVSADPIVDEPTPHDLNMQSRLEAEIAAENIDLVPDPESEEMDSDFNPEEDDNNSNKTLESPFEY